MFLKCFNLFLISTPVTPVFPTPFAHCASCFVVAMTCSRKQSLRGHEFWADDFYTCGANGLFCFCQTAVRLAVLILASMMKWLSISSQTGGTYMVTGILAAWSVISRLPQAHSLLLVYLTLLRQKKLDWGVPCILCEDQSVVVCDDILGPVTSKNVCHTEIMLCLGVFFFCFYLTVD